MESEPVIENANNVAADHRAPDGFVSDYLLYLLAAASDAASDQFHEKVRAAGLRRRRARRV